MKRAFLALLLLPSLALGQSLGELAKKERERREKNKREGKTAIVVSEEDLYPEGRPEAESGEAEGQDADGSETGAGTARRPGRSSSEYSEAESIGEDGVVTFIPPELPLPEKIELFQVMKRQYERQIRQIDEDIAKNEARLTELEAEIGATAAAGGAGLPVAPSAGTGASQRQMTGQESQSLVAEQNRLKAMNQQLTSRRSQLELDLEQKARSAGIPPGYYR